ncbi:hypothetical protein GN956_G18586 [Arapaima gigas]
MRSQDRCLVVTWTGADSLLDVILRSRTTGHPRCCCISPPKPACPGPAGSWAFCSTMGEKKEARCCYTLPTTA